MRAGDIALDIINGKLFRHNTQVHVECTDRYARYICQQSDSWHWLGGQWVASKNSLACYYIIHAWDSSNQVGFQYSTFHCAPAYMCITALLRHKLDMRIDTYCAAEKHSMLHGSVTPGSHCQFGSQLDVKSVFDYGSLDHLGHWGDIKWNTRSRINKYTCRVQNGPKMGSN